jgi:hypothetical protein
MSACSKVASRPQPDLATRLTNPGKNAMDEEKLLGLELDTDNLQAVAEQA